VKETMAVNENGLLGRRKDDGGEERIKKKTLPPETAFGGNKWWLGLGRLSKG